MLEHDARNERLHQKDQQTGSRVVQSKETQERLPFPKRLSRLSLEHEVK